MKKFFIIFSLLICLNLAGIVIPAGDVSGNWSAVDNPYYIDGEISIPSSETLTIESGVEVIFNDQYSLTVNGRLIAEGVLNDSITFSCIEGALGWNGIRFIDTSDNGLDSSILSYCLIEKGAAIGTGDFANGGGIFCSNSADVLIDHCLFNMNYASWDGGSIYLGNASDIEISNSTFTENDCGFYGGSIISYGSSPIISNCDFINNESSVFAAGISAWDSSSPEIYNCRFIDNYAGACCGIYGVSSNIIIVNSLFISNNTQFGAGGAVGLTSCSTIAVNNTIVDCVSALNGGAFWVNGGMLHLYNSILWGNQPNQIGFEGAGESDVYNSCIQDGFEGTDVISDNPEFLNYAEYDLHLTENSPCIDFGDASLPGIMIPETDLAGMTRILDGDGDGDAVIDLGAYEFELEIIFEPPAHINIDVSTGLMTWESPNMAGLNGFEIFLDGVMVAETTETEYQFTEIEAGIEYTAGIIAVYENGESDIVTVTFIFNPLSINQEIVEAAVSLRNYPNPFNPETKICFSLNKNSYIDLSIYNTMGQKIKNLHSGYLSADNYSFIWNGLDENENIVSSGIYFYRLHHDEKTYSGRMLLLK